MIDRFFYIDFSTMILMILTLCIMCECRLTNITFNFIPHMSANIHCNIDIK